MSDRDTLVNGLDIMGLSVDARALERLLVYFIELRKWKRKVNLVARDSTDIQILENHFLDSLTLLPLIQERISAGTLSLLDVGTGAGFPGLVLKVVCPGLEVTLVEPRQKRIFFLKHIVRTLGLEGVELINARLGEKVPLPQLSGRKFSIITSRALTDIAGFVAMTSAHLAESGLIICMKGPKGRDEIKIMEDTGAAGKFGLVRIEETRLPFSGAVRCLVVFSKPEKVTL